MIDTHAHIDDKQFDTDREQVISRSFSNGVEKIITVGAGLGSSERAMDLAERYRDIFASVGCHPEYFMKHGSWGQEHRKKIEELASAEKVVAIGEIGMEYHSHDGNPISEKQKEFQKEGFIFQLELARKLEKPVIIHCRGERAEAGEKYREKGEAYEDVSAIMERFSELDFVFHSFGGRLDFAEEIMTRRNCFFSFNGNITYAKPGAEILDVVRAIPLEKIMLETDCPYLAPVPHRGKRNEPSFVVHVCEKIAEIKGISAKKVDEISSRNAINFFKLD
jgi:TatD DNase family protein